MDDLHSWFESKKDVPVLHFHSLYNVQVDLGSEATHSWQHKWKKAIKSATYRQYK